MPTSYLDLEGLEYLWGKAGETFSPKNVDASSVAARGVEDDKIAEDSNPLIIEDVAYPQNTKDIVVDLSPVQDFNGYDKPWVGGAGKNLLPNKHLDNSDITSSGGGLTFTANQDGSVTVNGTATTTVHYTYVNGRDANYQHNLPNGTYKFVLNSPSNHGGAYLSLMKNSTYVHQDLATCNYNNKVTEFTINEDYDSLHVGIYFARGDALSNFTFSLMVVPSSVTDYTFEPYSNICPIYPANGKNLLPLNLNTIKLVNGDGTWNDNIYTRNGVTFEINTDSNDNVIDITVNGTASDQANINLTGNNTSSSCPFNGCVLSGCPVGGSNSKYDLRISDIDVGSSQDFGNGIKISVADTGKWNCLLIIRSGITVSNLVFKPMIRLASEDPTFIPYQSLNIKRNSKNLLPLTVDGIKALNTSGSWSGNEYTWNGITYTIMTDSSDNVIGIRGNGTASARGWIFLAEKDFAEEYVVFTSSGVLVNNYYFSSGNTLDDATNQFIYYNNSSKRTYLLIDNGHVVNDQIWYPMIRLARSKNLLNPISSSSTVNISFVKNTDGSLTFTGNSNGVTRLPLIQTLTLKAGKYILGGITGGSTETYGLRVRYNSPPNSSIVDLYNGEATFELSQETTIDVLGRFYSTLTNVNVTMKPFICIPIESDSIYEPYQPSSITLSLGQDVYGGTYDVGSGELTIDRGIVDMGDLKYLYITNASNPIFTSDSLHNIMKSGVVGEIPKVLSGAYEVVSSASRTSLGNNMKNGQFSVITNYGTFAIRNDAYTDVETFKTAMSGVQICYELATPITIPLSSLSQSNQLSLLQGYNVISSSDGISGIEVTYDAIQESNVQAEIDELGEISRVQAANSKATDDAIEEVRNAIDDLRDDTAIVISSVSSESKIASFNDGVEGFPVRDLEIEFEPVQDLHGYSKPWVGGAGKNLLDPSIMANRTTGGVTITKGVDAVASLSGTSNDDINYYICPSGTSVIKENCGFILPPGTYTFSARKKDGSAIGLGRAIGMFYWEGDSETRQIVQVNNNTSTSVTLSSAETLYVTPTIGGVAGKTTNFDVYFQLEKGSTATPWTPYSNICPIYPANSRNLLPMSLSDIKTINTEGTWSDNVYTRNGITFTLLENQDNQLTEIKANGTASGGDGMLRLHTGSLSLNGDYKMNGGINANAYVFIANVIQTSSTADVSFSTTGITNTIGVAVSNGTTVSNVSFKPMIRLASIADSTFTPYQAIEVKRIGKNLLPYPYYDSSKTKSGVTFTVNNDGSITLSGTATADVQFICSKSLVGSDIAGMFVSGCPSGGTTTTYKILMQVVEGSWTTVASDIGSGAIIEQSASGNIIQCVINIKNGVNCNNLVFKPMIYEPYTSTTLTLPMGQDIYGGRYNVISGELTITHGIVDMGTLTWAKSTGSNSANVRFYSNDITSTAKPPVANNILANILCSSYQIDTADRGYSGTGGTCVAMSTTGQINIYDNNYQNTSVADFKTAMSGVQLCYELATPLTYVLTPQQLTTLSKSNVIMTDSGYISNCEYYADAKTYVDERFVYVITNSQIDNIFDTLERG